MQFQAQDNLIQMYSQRISSQTNAFLRETLMISTVHAHHILPAWATAAHAINMYI